MTKGDRLIPMLGARSGHAAARRCSISRWTFSLRRLLLRPSRPSASVQTVADDAWKASVLRVGSTQEAHARGGRLTAVLPGRAVALKGTACRALLVRGRDGPTSRTPLAPSSRSRIRTNSL